MNRKLWARRLGAAAFGLMALFLCLSSLPAQRAYAQQPTGSIPTVTSTPLGPMVTVFSDQTQIGVFNGPSAEAYTQIGILISGQTVPVLGISSDEKWLQIVYMGVRSGKGWIYASYVKLTPGARLSRVEAPPTATPATTPTLDPTYVAAFGLTLEPTQLATFTAPGALVMPTYAAAAAAGSKIPYGLIILSLVFIGLLGAVVSFLRGSR
jgi:hypothetical protein